MDPDQEKNQNNSTPNGGIFSTPDLTVDANKIANPTQNNDKSRIASIFANTDAGRESQRLNDAMGANPTENSQPLEGDLVIQNEPKKKSKLPLILAAAVLLAVIGGVVAFLLLSKSTNTQTPQTPLEAFEDYRKYIISGDTNEEQVDTDDWLIYNFASSGMNDEAINKYADTAIQKMQTFIKISENSGTNLQVNMELYAHLLNLFAKVGNLNNIKKTLLTRYVDNGAESAYNYITEISPLPLNDKEYRSVDVISDTFKKYLEDELNLLEQYSGWGCIDNYSVSLECVYDKSEQSVAYTTLTKSQSSKQSGMSVYLKGLRSPFTEITGKILNELKG